MVIQSNMSPKAIVEVWKNTVPIFEKYNIPLTEKILQSTIETDILLNLLNELNSIIGSSSSTCIKGG